jgi:hypothetical protein
MYRRFPFVENRRGSPWQESGTKHDTFKSKESILYSDSTGIIPGNGIKKENPKNKRIEKIKQL